jgi:hypothetical protein
LRIENEGAADPLLRMMRRDAAGLLKPPLPPPRRATPSRDKQLGEDTIIRIRKDFPGWDVYALKVEFDAWLTDRAAPPPHDYQAAFYGFVRRYHEKNAA